MRCIKMVTERKLKIFYRYLEKKVDRYMNYYYEANKEILSRLYTLLKHTKKQIRV